MRIRKNFYFYINFFSALKEDMMKMKVDLEFKKKNVADSDIKIKEIKSECSVLQISHQRLQSVKLFFLFIFF